MMNMSLINVRTCIMDESADSGLIGHENSS